MVGYWQKENKCTNMYKAKNSSVVNSCDFRRVKDFLELTRILILWRAGHKGFPDTKWATNKKFCSKTFRRLRHFCWRIENAVDGETSSNKTSCLSLTSCLGNPCVPPFIIILVLLTQSDFAQETQWYEHSKGKLFLVFFSKSKGGGSFWGQKSQSFFFPFSLLFFFSAMLGWVLTEFEDQRPTEMHRMTTKTRGAASIQTTNAWMTWNRYKKG